MEEYILKDDFTKEKTGLVYRKVIEKYSDNTTKTRFQYFSECGSWQYSSHDNINDFKRMI